MTVGGEGQDQQLLVEYAKPFQFLNLGALAYVGASKALAQISIDDRNVLGKGSLGFLLWRGVYWFKQVSWRNRVLIIVDWIKARLFGRDIGSLTF
jgi:NADH dehydrogenase FAD-containing subunit